MRILRIAGEGLASLVQPFVVDLTAEPLKGAGLFAITGPTGAGKSTILDAVCLAIYGQYPRAGHAGPEKIADVNEEELAAGDERSILSKGAAWGCAEAEFIGLDGQHYLARWQVRRARDRPDGKLQRVERSLARIGDGGIEMIAAQAREIDREVEAATGFTFEQFRRTVLLAQGDVDAFLRARPKDRAALLDKITNTGVYAEISRRVHELCRVAEASIERLAAELGGIGLMPPERRSGLEAERREAEQALISHKQERDRIDGEIVRHGQIEACRAALVRAESDLAEAVRQQSAAAEQKARLDLLDKAAALRPMLHHLEAARAETDKCRQAHTSANDELTRCADALGDAAAVLARRAQEEQASELEFQELVPLWEEAARLDGEIANARKDAAELREKVNRQRMAAVDAAASAQESTSRLAELEKQLRQVGGELRSHGAARLLAEQWPTVEGDLPKRDALRRDSHKLAGSLANIASERGQIVDRLDQASAGIAEIRDQAEALRERAAQKASALKAAENPALEARAASLDQLAERARIMQEAARRHAAARSRLALAERTQRDEADALARHMEAARSAQARLSEARDRRGADQLLFDLAEAAVSTKAVELRAALVEGEPCPVCGSATHRQAEETAELVAALKLRKAAIDAQIEEAERLEAEALGQAAAARSRQGVTEEQVATHRSEMVEARQAYGRSRALFLADRRQKDRDLAASADPDPVATESLIAMIDERRAACRERLKASSALRQERDQLVEAAEGFERELARLTEDRSALAGRLSELKEAAAVATERSHGLHDRIASIDRELKPLIEPLGLSELDLDRDPDGLVTQLAKQATAYRALADRFRGCESEIAKLNPRCVESRSLEERVLAQLREDEAVLVGREERIDELRLRRAGLLAGEETGAHRARLTHLRRQVREAFKLAEAAHGVTKAEEATAASRAASLAALVDQARMREDRAADDLADSKRKLALSDAELATLMAVDDSEVEELRAGLSMVADAVSRMAALVDERERDLAVALAGGEPQADVEILAHRRLGLTEDLEQLQRRIGEVDGILRSDDDNRLLAGDLEERIAVANAEVTTWREVWQAVGSADGSKFQRFAQSVTLTNLVHLANIHLADLNPRYRLETAPGSDLGLQIVDLEQDEARRSTVSLSGGERFLTSLALALALSGLEGRMSFVDTLFIDEGFGSLDADTLDVAIDALERLHGKGRKVGVISHVEAMHERIPVQIRVEKRSNGRSVVAIEGAAPASQPELTGEQVFSLSKVG
jgi:DNA repair protein SbcC/Rad50